MLVVGVGVAALAAALALYLLVERVGAAGLPLAVLRAVTWGALAALLVNPGCRRLAGLQPTIVLLDHSLSMSSPRDTAGGGARWRAALDTARALAGRRGRILLFGTEPVALGSGSRPDAPATRLLPAWREAAALGGPVAVVTDGEVDDAASLPPDFLRFARVVVLPRPAAADVGVAALELPPSLRAGDTATATVVLAAARTAPADTATLELLDGARVVARERVAVGGGGTFRRELRFVPAPPPATTPRMVRRFTARVSGVRDDAEPRDDARTTAAEVSRASAIALFSDSPDWDFRWLALILRQTSGVPVSAYVRVTPGGPWRDADSLRPVSPSAIAAAARGATLVVVHGSAAAAAPLAALARHALWRWTGAAGTALAGDWYIQPGASASPVGGALAGVPADSLPPLQALAPARADSAEWTALAARLGRRGAARPVIAGSEVAGRRVVRLLGWGLWRWASQGGVAAQGYRALVAALTDWSLAAAPGGEASLAALRDSLSRGLDELLPRQRTLQEQPGRPVAAVGGRAPLRQEPWVYGLVLAALMMEWIARRRRGMR